MFLLYTNKLNTIATQLGVVASLSQKKRFLYVSTEKMKKSEKGLKWSAIKILYDNLKK